MLVNGIAHTDQGLYHPIKHAHTVHTAQPHKDTQSATF